MNFLFTDAYLLPCIIIFIVGLLLFVLSFYSLYQSICFYGEYIFPANVCLLGVIFMCTSMYILSTKGYLTTTTLEYIFYGIPKMEHKPYRLIKHVMQTYFCGHCR